MVKQDWMGLDDRIDLALGHLTQGLDWRRIAKGTPLEGLPYTSAYMGRHLTMVHAYPELMECPGRYLTSLTLLLEENPTFSCNGVTGVAAAERQVAYIAGKINAQGHYVTTQAELDAINAPEKIFADPARPDGTAEEIAKIKAGWYGRAGVEYNGHLSILMEGLVRWYLLTGDKKAKAAIDRAVSGPISDPKHPEILAGHGMVLPGMMTPITLYYAATGDGAAKAYLDALVDDFVRKVHLKYFPDGLHAHGDGVGHLHCRMGGIAGFARYAKLAGRTDYLAAAERLLAANLLWGTEFGYLPERHVYCNCGAGSDTGHIYQPWVLGDGKTVDFSFFTRPRAGWDTCEICVTADAIDAAMVLADSGYEHYWEVAERMVNHLFRAQLTDTSRLLDRDPHHPREILGATFEHVREALRGAFSITSTPTCMFIRQNYGRELPDGRDGVCEKGYYTVHTACCPAWGARTLGLLRNNTVKEDGGRVEVNLPFDRTTASVEVTSRLPFEGTIRVAARKPVDLLVRIPDWVEHGRVEVRVNGKKRDRVDFKNAFGDHVRIGRLKAGERAEVRYPLRKEKKRYYIDYHPCLYEVDWLGNYVTGMDEIRIEKPEGENTFEGLVPLYAPREERKAARPLRKNACSTRTKRNNSK